MPLDHGSRKHSAKLTQILDTLECTVLVACSPRVVRRRRVGLEVVVSKNPIDVEQRGVSDEVLDQLAVETLR